MASLARFSQSSWLRFPRVILLCLILATVLALPGMRMGLFVDDYFHLATIEGLVPYGNLFSLFEFGSGIPEQLEPRIAMGPYPWFTLPQFKASFFRPLSCVLMGLDHAVFGRHIAGWHLHSLIWYLLLIAAWGLILRRCVPGVVGVLALVLFTVDQVHWFPVTWTANRNALVATAPVLWGLYAHMRWREDGWRPGLPLSLAGYVLGLLGGESALGAMAYLGAYELFAGKGTVRARVGSLVPAGILGVVYLVAYKLGGYGAFGSGLYIDPIGEPMEYLANAPARMLGLIACELMGWPVDASVFTLWLRPIQAVAGLATVVLFALLLRKAWSAFDAPQRRALAWMIPGALLALLPVVATFASSRLLLMPSLGASVVLSSVLVYGWQERKRGTTRWWTVLVGFLIVVHGVLPPIAWAGQSTILAWFANHTEQVCLAAEMDPASTPDRHYLVLVGPDPLVTIYTPIIRCVSSKTPFPTSSSWHVVSQAPHAHRVTRTAPNRIEVEVLDGSMWETEFEKLFRSPRFPMRPGDRVQLSRSAITVLEVGREGPSKVAVECDAPLDDPAFRFLVWKDGCLRRAQLPAIGESMILPRERGLL